MLLRCDAQLHESTASDAHLELASSWLRHCKKKHKCQAAKPLSTALPTRLMDLRQSKIDKTKIVLCYTAQLDQQPSYVTLSHCWGEGKPLKLNKDNEPSMLESLTLSQLPLTFRDAVHVTRQLGFRYLWIDSLCIIQDSQEDWEIESAKMWTDLLRRRPESVGSLGQGL